MDRIKSFVVGLGRSTRVLVLALAVVIAGAGVVQAATTISTSILTNGTLGVTGVSTFGATASTTISAAGVLTTPSGAVALFLGGASTTQFTLLSGDTIKNTSASSTEITGTLTTATSSMSGLTVTSSATLASTTATTMKVGHVGTGMTRIVSGYCVTASISIPATNASSTQTYANCTPSGGASVITSGDRVFVQATSSLPYYIVVQSASSTASGGLITVGLTNFSTSTSPAAAIYSFNFWAFQ